MSQPKSRGHVASVRGVAQRARVSIATVSRALNDPDAVSLRTRTRVLDAVQELGYEPSALGRNLVRGRSFLVGLIVPNVAWPLYGPMIRGVEDMLGPAGMRALSASSLDTQGGERAAAESLLGHAVDGGIVINSQVGAGLPTRRGAPWVHVTPEDPGVRWRVELDNVEGGRLAARLLLAGGHRRFAHVSGNGHEGEARERGFAEELCAAGHAYRRFDGDYSEASGHAAVRDLLAGEAPDAVFVAGDLMAVGVMRALRAHRLRVPQDVSVVGFDDADVAQYVEPPLTTVRQPAYEMGAHAARVLLRLLGGEDAPPVVLPPQLIVRASTRPIPLGRAPPG